MLGVALKAHKEVAALAISVVVGAHTEAVNDEDDDDEEEAWTRDMQWKQRRRISHIL